MQPVTDLFLATLLRTAPYGADALKQLELISGVPAFWLSTLARANASLLRNFAAAKPLRYCPCLRPCAETKTAKKKIK